MTHVERPLAAEAIHTVRDARTSPATSDEDAAAVLAHELRGPLAVVNGYLDLVRRAEDGETREYAIDAAQRAVTRMDAIIDDVLGAAAKRHESPNTEGLVDPVCVLRSLIDEVPGYRKRVEFSSSCRSHVRAEELRLARAVSNVLDNALKFSPPTTKVHLMLVDDEGVVRMIVEDEGPGIPLEEARRLRGVFERLDRDGGVPGYGIGLGVAVELMHDMSGDLALGNRPDGKGARVELTLPAC